MGSTACEAADPDPDPAGLRAELPSTSYCDGVRDWPDAWIQHEREVVARIDQWRARGGECGTEGKPGRAEPLLLDGALTCAARVHAVSMAEQGFVGHAGPDGSEPTDRIADAGYPGGVVEHVVAGAPDADALIDEVLAPSDVHCRDVLSRLRDDVGVGFLGEVDDERGTYWVILLGVSQTE